MSDFLDEEVPPVNPLSMAVIEELGRCFLAQLVPDVLHEPSALDVGDLIDVQLPRFGIHVCPVSRAEIGDRAGATDPSGDGQIDILVSEGVWDGLEHPAPTSHFARTTICHEVGHAVLHVPILRQRLQLTNALARVERRRLKAYEDPEWQAWAFAGAILMPSTTLRMLQRARGSLTPEALALTYEVSVPMARSHLKRLKWPNAEG